MLIRQKTNQFQTPKIYIVGVPIGNYDDITLRAIKTLEMVDIIYCEDTRVTKKLLNHFNINKPLRSYHTFNENETTANLIDLVKKGNNIAVVSDAGMPIISDPGFLAVRQAIQNNIDIVVVPGACAFVSALVGSGISSNRIIFTGFLNASENKRRKELEKLKDLTETLILYESPHRIKETLQILADLMPERQICLARELTKLHEEYLHGTPVEILEVVDEVRGEIVIIIEPAQIKEIKKDLNEGSLIEHMNHYINQGYSEKDAMKMVAKDRGISKSIIYQQLKKK